MSIDLRGGSSGSGAKVPRRERKRRCLRLENHAITARSERRFHLVDALVLVAAAGLGLALDRNALDLVLAGIAEQRFRSFNDIERFAGWFGHTGFMGRFNRSWFST